MPEPAYRKKHEVVWRIEVPLDGDLSTSWNRKERRGRLAEASMQFVWSFEYRRWLSSCRFFARYILNSGDDGKELHTVYKWDETAAMIRIREKLLEIYTPTVTIEIKEN